MSKLSIKKSIVKYRTFFFDGSKYDHYQTSYDTFSTQVGVISINLNCPGQTYRIPTNPQIPLEAPLLPGGHMVAGPPHELGYSDGSAT